MSVNVQLRPDKHDPQLAAWTSKDAPPHTPVDTEALKALLLRVLFIAAIPLGFLASASAAASAEHPAWIRLDLAAALGSVGTAVVGLLLIRRRRYRRASTLAILSGVLLIFLFSISRREMDLLHYLIVIMPLARVFWGQREMRWLVVGTTVSVLALPLIIPGWTVMDLFTHGLLLIMLTGIALEAAHQYLMALEHQRQAERLEHEARYRQLIEAAPMGVVVYTGERLVYANPAALNIIGAKTVEDVLGLRAEDLVHSDFHAARAELLRALEQNRTFPVHVQQLVRLDGEIRDVEAQLMAATFDGQHAVRVFLRDITEHRRAESALQQSEARLHALLSAVPDLIFRISGDGIFLDYKTAGIGLAAPPEEFLGRHVREVFPFLAEGAEGAISAALSTGQIQIFNYSISHEDEYEDYEARVVPSGPDEVTVIVRQVTQARRAEQALRKSEARQRALLSAIPDLIYTLNRDGQITEISAQEPDRLPQPAEQIPGRSLNELFPPETARLLLEAARRTLDTGISQTVEYALDLPSGRVCVEGRLVLSGEGEVLMIARDITERKRAEQALRRRDAILTTLAYAGEQLLRSGALDDVLPEVLARLGEAMQANRVTIFENHVADDGDLLMSERCRWLAPGVETPFDQASLQGLSYHEIGFGAWPETLRAGGVLVGPVRERPESEQPRLLAAHVQSLLTVPIFAGDAWWGYLSIDSAAADREWPPVEVEAVRNLAGTLGAAIMRQRTEAAEREQRDFVEALRDTAALITSTLDLDEVLDRILASLAKTIRHDAASIVLLLEGGTLRLARSRGYGSGDVARTFEQVLLSPAGNAYLRQVLDGKGPLITPDMRQQCEICTNLPGAEWVRAHLAVPLEFDGQAIGVLSLASGTPGQYTATHAERAQAFASQAAAAIRNAQLFEHIQHHANALETLRRFGLSISAELDLDALLRLTLKNALELLGVSAGGVYLYHPERQVLEWVVSAGTPQPPLGSEIPADTCLAGQALLSGQVQVVNDFRTWDGTRLSGLDYDDLAVIAAPINRQDQSLGVLVAMTSPAERTFTEQDARLLRLFGNQASIAIQNAQLFKAEREQHMLSEALRDVAVALGSTPNAQDIFRHLLLKVRELIPYDAADIMLVEGGIGRVVYQQGYDRFGVQDWIQNVRLFVRDDPELSRIVEEGKFSLHSTVTSEPGWRATMLAETRIFQSYVAVPMFSEGRVIGVVSLASSAPSSFTTKHVDWLRAFANQAAITLENTRLYAELSRHVEEMAALHRGTSFLFASLSSRDLEDVGAEIAKALAHKFAGADCAVLLVDEDEGRCTPLGRAGACVLPDPGPLSLGEPSLVAEAVRTRSQVYHPELSADGDGDDAEAAVTGSELVVPVIAAKGIIAVLHLRSADPNAFNPQDRNILAAFAERVAAVLENRLLYDEIRRHTEELEQHVQARTIDLSVRNAVAQTLSSSLDMCEMLNGVLQTTVEELHVLGGAIYLLNPESDALELVAHCGISTDDLSLVTGITPGSADLSFSARTSAQGYDLPQETGISAVLSVPIWRHEHIRGIITLVHDEPRPWRSEETRMLDAIGRQIGVALANAELYAEAVRGEAHIRTILRSVADGLLVFDPAGNLVLMNPAAEALFAFYPPDAGGPQAAAHHLMAWLQAHHELKAGPVNVEFALPEIALTGENSTILGQCVRMGCGGAGRRNAAWPCWLKMPQDPWWGDESCPVIQRMPRRSIRAHSADITDADGTDLGLVIVLHDVTYFRELDDLKGRFVSTVSHELRTPLTAILLQISTLLKYYHRFDDLERFEMLTEMEQQATILRELIEDILELSRFDSKRNVGHKRWMNLAEQCRGVLTSLRPVCEEKALTLEVTGLDTPCFIDGDVHQLERVCRNLLSNAIKYTPEGGRIAVTLEQENDHVLLRIADSGIGIAPEDLPHVFDRFFRAEQASRIASGTGLGLAIVKEIIDLHEGRIEVQSVPGEGSTFTVLLPASVPDEAPEAGPDPHANGRQPLRLDNG